MSYPFRDGGLSGADAARKAISVIEKQVGAENLAAVIIEPIQGEGGFIVPADGFLEHLLRWCRSNDVVFIADEIQTGFGRTGAMFASELFGIVPDLITTAKGIAAGLPLAAVTGRADIMDAAHAGGLGGTYGGNPIACAAANANPANASSIKSGSSTICARDANAECGRETKVAAERNRTCVADARPSEHSNPNP